jgi:hypothetical protein
MQLHFYTYLIYLIKISLFSNRITKNRKNVKQPKIVMLDRMKACESSGEVRLEVQSPKLNAYNSTSTCKKL